MNLDGRRESSNVEDRRGSRGNATKLGIGGGMGAILALVLTMCMGGNGGLDLGSILGGLGDMGGLGMTTDQTANTTEVDPSQFSEEEQELAKFSRVIEASTEDVWTNVFQRNGYGQYTPPTLVLYTGSTSTACGQGSAAVGPFYCSGDQKLYIDLSFFSTMQQTLGASGDLAYAYVIAHEVGHHIEYLTGILDKAHQEMSRYGSNSAQANEISVRLELLADFYAGVWAHHEKKSFGSIDDKDLRDAINCAHQIGDDYLQKNARGYAVPESFTHGTSEQRMRWFKKGYETGDMSKGNTFQVSYSSL